MGPNADIIISNAKDNTLISADSTSSQILSNLNTIISNIINKTSSIF